MNRTIAFHVANATLARRRTLCRVANQLLATAFPALVLFAFALGWALAIATQ